MVGFPDVTRPGPAARLRHAGVPAAGTSRQPECRGRLHTSTGGLPGRRTPA